MKKGEPSLLFAHYANESRIKENKELSTKLEKARDLLREGLRAGCFANGLKEKVELELEKETRVYRS